MNDHLRHVADLAARQHGAINGQQLTEAQRRRLVRNGVLERVGSHTFRSPFAPSSAMAELAALVLDCGDGAVASGPTAAALLGFDGYRLRPPFHVTVPRGRNVQRAHHHLHTTDSHAQIDRSTVEGVPTMSATRTLIDLARSATPAALTAALDSALRDRLTSEHALHKRIAALRSSGRYGIPALLAVIEGMEASRGAHSWLERRFLELCATARVPAPQTQQILTRAGDRLVRVDCRFPGTPIVVELFGYRWHRTNEQMSRDASRMNALILDGLLPMQLTYAQVTNEPDWVVSQVHAAFGVIAA